MYCAFEIYTVDPLCLAPSADIITSLEYLLFTVSASFSKQKKRCRDAGFKDASPNYHTYKSHPGLHTFNFTLFLISNKFQEVIFLQKKACIAANSRISSVLVFNLSTSCRKVLSISYKGLFKYYINNLGFFRQASLVWPFPRQK